MQRLNKNTNWLMKSMEYKLKILRCLFSDDVKYKSKKHIKDFGNIPNLITPETFNEKVIFRILYDHNPRFTFLANKINAKLYISRVIGPQYVVPVIGTYTDFDKINFEKLPLSFVLKCNHDSESSIICHDKVLFVKNKEKARKKLNFCLKRNMYYTTREKHYRNIEPLIICEEYLNIYNNRDRETTPELYRVHCFDSRPEFIEVDFTDSNGKEFVNIYNYRWELQNVTVGYPNKLCEIKLTDELDELLKLSTILSSEFDYVRLDWFIADGNLYFSEFTFTPCAGRMQFNPGCFDYFFGVYWNQRISK